MHTVNTIKAIALNVWVQILFWVLIGAFAVSGFFVENYMGNASRHFVMEMASGFTAIAVAIIAFAASAGKRDVLMPFIAIAHLCAGLTDLLHALFARGIMLLPTSVMERFIPGSWTAGRTTLALILLIGVICSLKRGERSTGILPGIIMASGLTVAAVVLFAVVDLPAFILPDAEWVNRPWEILSLLLFIATIVLIVIRNKKVTDTDTNADIDISYLIIPGLILHIATQLIMTGSPVLFNAYFDASHLLKNVSYVAILVPVIYSILLKAKYSIVVKSLLLPSSFSIMAMALVMFSVVETIDHEPDLNERTLDRNQLALTHQLQRHANSMMHSYHEYIFMQSDSTMDEFWIAYDSVYDIFGILKAEKKNYELDFNNDMEVFAVYAYNMSRYRTLSSEQIEEFKNKADFLMIKINRLISIVAEQELMDLERSDEEALNETKYFILLQVYFLMVILPLIITISMWQVRRQTRPITELNSLALRVSRGEYDLSIGGEGADEIGVLGRSFNRMLKSLNDTMSGLEQNVAQRTNELQTSKQHLQSVVDNIDDGIVTANLEGTIETTNSAIDKIFGYENNEIVGKNIRILMPEKMHKSHDHNIQKYQKFKIPTIMGSGNILQTAIRKSGEIFPIEIAVTEVVEKERHTLVAIIRDISERKKVETILMESEERMSRFFRASMEGLFFQKDGKILDVNESGASMAGYETEEVVGHSLFEFIAPEYHEITLERMRSNFEGPWLAEVICKNGDRLPVEIQASVHVIDGDDVGIVAVRDVSDRLKVEKESFQLATELTMLIDTANAPIFGVDKKGMINEWNKKTEELTGYTKDEVIGCMLLYEFVTEESREAVKQVFSDALEGISTEGYELPLITKFGKDLLLLLNATTRRDYNGNITGVVGVGQDITELDAYRTRMEQKVHDRTQELNAIFTLSPDGFVLIDGDGDVMYVNPAFLDMTGYEIHELITIPESEFFAKINLLLTQDKDKGEGEGKGKSMSALTEDEFSEILYLSKPSTKVLKYTLKSIADEAGDKKGHVLYFRDITYETEVDQMKSDFLSTAAHELRTPLASILGFSELMLTHDYNAERRKDINETIHRQSEKLKHLLDELLDLARIEARSGKDFNIERSTLAQVVKLACEEAKGIDDDHELVLNNGTEWPLIDFDESKTHQVLMNVLSNAYKYSDNNTQITCSTTTRSRDSHSEFGIRVEDQGIGMTKQELARVGERFYRADDSGSVPGTGLGIALVKEIMEIQQGEMEISSKKGKGTTVTLWFPVISKNTIEQYDSQT